MTTATKWQKLISRIKRADDILKKTKIWDAADLSKPEAEQVVGQMILSLPKGHYKVHDKQYGTNIVGLVYETYGWMPAAHVSEKLLLGLQALYPDRVYASFTHGLDAVEIKRRSIMTTATQTKEPWEMTQAEWVDGHIKSPAMHKEHVRHAVQAGKKVPKEVLQHYGASVFVRDPAPVIPKAAPGSPEAGLQVDMMGKTTLVQPKGKGTAVTASMESYAKLEAMKAEAKAKAPPKPRPAPKPKAEAEAPAKPTGGRTLSYADAAELLAGLELRAEAIAERLDHGQAELESMKESLDPRLAKLTALIPATKEGRSEITHITKGQYRKVWGREPKSQILTADGKRVRWEYALDEIAQELHLEDKADREGVNPDEYVKGLIEDARDAKQIIAATEHELRSDQATLKAIERLKLDVKAREGEVTSAPLVASMAASKPKPRTKAEVKAKGMLAEEAMKLIARVQAKRSPGAIAMDNAILANKVLPMSKAHIWAKAPNRYDIKGIDTPGRGKIVAGVGYADKGAKRLSRKPRKGWRKVKLA